jgi:hypothetical protein
MSVWMLHSAARCSHRLSLMPISRWVQMTQFLVLSDEGLRLDPSLALILAEMLAP